MITVFSHWEVKNLYRGDDRLNITKSLTLISKSTHSSSVWEVLAEAGDNIAELASSLIIKKKQTVYAVVSSGV